jgi:multimeric flavodoxin WrbA
MRVLAIMGSPRGKGNTYRLVREIEDRLDGQVEAEFEYLFLKDVNLQPCRGCGACLRTGEHACPLADDRAAVEDRIAQSRGVILATPVYAMDMSWLMKLFLDRLAYRMHRPRFFDQVAMLVCTSGGSGTAETLDRLGVVRHFGFSVAHRLGLLAPPVGVDPDYGAHERARAVETASRTYARALLDPRRAVPALSDLMRFRTWQALASALRVRHPADYEYFRQRGWLERAARYYYDAPVSPVKDLIARWVGRSVRGRLARAMGPQRSKADEHHAEG